jgi:DNA helicase II / ATP-dependent DNA helicase PcrA
MNDPIFKDLNEKQIEAVKIIDGPVLVISGPGSGKTRCLTHRVAYLIQQGIPPENILSVTFTNKASQEMRERISHLLNYEIPKLRFGVQDPRFPHIGTFHSIGLKILRNDIPLLGYRSNFNVLDDDEQLSVLKRVMADIGIDTKSFNPKIILAKISELKTKLIFPESHEPKDYYAEIVDKAYRGYQKELRDHNLTDFDDLIVLPIKIFRQNPEVLTKYQDIWRYILVDEYQDTSYDQYIFIKLLSEKYRNLFCIGDDAQSIYQFRRADIRNILNYQKDYPEAKIVMLEQNYRSTKNIITAAQEIISKNKNQLPKSLWTANDSGGKIIIAETVNEKHEAGFVISKIEDLMKKTYSAKDFAVLYRTHAQSRALEESLIMAGHPYQIIGGLKFYERKEIKDMLAYLKIAVNPSDLIALERVYNIPARGIGKATIEKIMSLKNNVIEALKEKLGDESLPPKQSKAISDFHKTLTDIVKTAETKNLREVIKYTIKKISYEDYLKEFSLSKTNDHENFEDRLENLKELQTVASKYDEMPGREGIERFLEEVALLQHTDKLRDNPDRITLMTVHASKGLEFPIVFIVGAEEGIFPHSRSIYNPTELEEERRLCYVAITRAKEHLILTYTKFRRIFGSASAALPSRFIGEIPSKLVDWQLLDGFEDDSDDKIFY